ncbi:MAG: AIR synthase related protein, partial [Lentisphaeria bacterium]
MGSDKILLGHGGGGRLTAELLGDILQPLHNPVLDKLDDSAEIEVGNAKLAFTTDSYVIDPLEFPGGDIGRLAVCGTVNDLTMQGARPAYLSLALIVEEGLSVAALRSYIRSVGTAAEEAGVEIATGDTKVVERGH